MTIFGHGLYTPPIKIGPRASAWPDDEVEILNAARIAGKSDQEIRELVCKLVAARAWADVWVHQMIQRPRGMAPTTRRARRAAEEASPDFSPVVWEGGRTSWHNMFWINRLCRKTRTAL